MSAPEGVTACPFKHWAAWHSPFASETSLGTVAPEPLERAVRVQELGRRSTKRERLEGLIVAGGRRIGGGGAPPGLKSHVRGAGRRAEVER